MPSSITQTKPIGRGNCKRELVTKKWAAMMSKRNIEKHKRMKLRTEFPIRKCVQKNLICDKCNKRMEIITIKKLRVMVNKKPKLNGKRMKLHNTIRKR
jgi:hypothetical protein